MERLILNEQQVEELVRENAYKVTPENHFMARCIDGRFLDQDAEEAPLAFPGADAGQLDVLLATTSRGVEVNREKVYESLVEVVGGAQNIRMHTDDHSQGLMDGCGNQKKHLESPESFNLTKEDVEFTSGKNGRGKRKRSQGSRG